MSKNIWNVDSVIQIEINFFKNSFVQKFEYKLNKNGSKL